MIIALHVSEHCCIRVVKETLALNSVGVGTLLTQRRFANQDMAPLYPPALAFYDTPAQLIEQIKRLKGTIDVIHVHNEPNWQVLAAKDALPNVPVVMDCHDLGLLRDENPQPREIVAVKAADALIYPCQGYADRVPGIYNVAGKPSAVVHSYLPAELFIKGEMASRYNPIGGIVYEGNVFAGPSDSPAWYRDYRDIAKQFSRLGVPFTLYGVHNRYIRAYLETGAIPIASIPYSALLPQLARYDWGLVAFPRVFTGAEVAMPNKLFEYIAAGLPIIVHNAPAVADFVREHGIGVVLDDISDLEGCYGSPRLEKLKIEKRNPCRDKLMEVRSQFTMEREIRKVVDIYRNLTGKEAGVHA